MAQQAIYINQTNPLSTYIRVGFGFKGYKRFHLHGYVDTGASICIASKHIIPDHLWITMEKPIIVQIANGKKIVIDKVAKNVDLLIEGYTFKCPSIYQQDSGMDFIFGNNFLLTYRPFIQELDYIVIHTLEGEPVVVPKKTYALRQAFPGFINGLKKRKRGDISPEKTRFKPINITIAEQQLENIEPITVPSLDPVEPNNQISIVENAIEEPTKVSNKPEPTDSDAHTHENLDDSIHQDSEQIENSFLYQLNWHDEILSLLQKASAESPLSKKNTNRELASLELIDPNKVISVKGIAYTPGHTVEINKQIKELLELGVIRPSKSPHSSPCFLVNKHSEQKRGKPRLVINYKALNEATKGDGYLLPNKESILAAIRGKTHFTGLDCKSGFWQIRLDEKSKPLTAFSCPMGQFEWNVLPFGLKQAPGIFQRFMDTCFKKYDKFVRVYVDDILVFSDTEEDHYKHVKQVLNECISQGIILSEKKAEINKSKINYLGLQVERGVLQLQPHILEKIENFPDKIPDKTTLQRFLGCLNYARTYIQGLAQSVKPLQSKLKKDLQWTWCDNDSDLVRKVKRKVKNLPALHLPEMDEQLIIETDASNEYWGGVLKSRYPANHNSGDTSEKLCGYASGTFQGAELRYHSNEKEILAVKKVIKRFKLFIASNHFIIRSDNKNFGFFLRAKVQDDYKQGRLIRWQQWFNYYKFTVEHIPGTHNSLADSLTRELALAFEDISLSPKPPWKHS